MKGLLKVQPFFFSFFSLLPFPSKLPLLFLSPGLVEKNALSLISPLLYESDFSIVALSMSVLAFVGLYRLTRDSIDDQIIHSLLQVFSLFFL